jgi:hypothetical protein
VVHADFKQPVFDLLFLILCDHVFHGHVDIVGRRDISDTELIVFGDVVVVGVFDNLIYVKVAV